MDGRTEGQTERGKTVYPPPPSGSGGIKKPAFNKYLSFKEHVKYNKMNCELMLFFLSNY
jgi:hypothetical protein